MSLEVGPFFILNLFAKPCLVDLDKGTYILNAYFGHILKLMNTNARTREAILEELYE
jgi:hypothetical protein